jgi:hypothetical protein
MKTISINKRPLHSRGHDTDLKQKTPAELIGMMWQLALNAWAFKENLNVEPRLQRHVVVLKRRKG